jgi:hypothetical protein
MTISVLEGGGDDIMSGPGIFYATPAGGGIATNGSRSSQGRSALVRHIYLALVSNAYFSTSAHHLDISPSSLHQPIIAIHQHGSGMRVRGEELDLAVAGHGLLDHVVATLIH